MVSSLGLGELRYQYKERDHLIEKKFKINGGVVEVLNNKVLVLVE